MRRGDLVPDETVLALVAERVGCLRCQGGFLLDGFPRTVAQAEALEKLLAGEKLKLDAVLSYDLPLEQVVSRLSGRRTCPDCKAVFHIEDPATEGRRRCDHCGGKLYQREDDRPESIRVRMEAYERSTAPARLISIGQRICCSPFRRKARRNRFSNARWMSLNATLTRNDGYWPGPAGPGGIRCRLWWRSTAGIGWRAECHVWEATLPGSCGLRFPVKMSRRSLGG